MLGHKKELAILLALGCGWTLGGMSSGGGTASSVSLFNHCEANVQVKIGTTKADAVETTVQNGQVKGMGYVSIIDSAGSASYNIQEVYGKTTVVSENDASNATVEIDAGANTIGSFVCGGFSNNTTNANGNTICIKSGNISRSIDGGYSASGTASNNTIKINNDDGGTINTRGINGGEGTDASYNKIHIGTENNAADITIQYVANDNVYGGSGTTASNNELVIGGGNNRGTINLGSSFTMMIAGGNGATASNNTITIGSDNNSGTITGVQVSGTIKSTNASNNIVNVGVGSNTGNISFDHAIVGANGTNVTATNNLVNVGTENNAGTITAERVSGAYVGTSGTLDKNIVRIGTDNNTGNIHITGNVQGAASNYSQSTSTFTNNEVYVGTGNNTGAIQIDGGVYGSERGLYDSYSSATLENNKVYIGNMSNTGSVTIGHVYGACASGYLYVSYSGIAQNNEVHIQSGTVNESVTGARSYKFLSTNNRVYISGGHVVGSVRGGAATYAKATANEVFISGGTVSGDVYGGESSYDTASGNSVTISGGTIEGNVYGGDGNGTGGSAEHNFVNLYGTADVYDSSLYGTSKWFSGNELNIGYVNPVTHIAISWTGGNHGQCVQNIANFKNIHFKVVPWWEDTPTLKKPALTIIDGANSNLSNTTVDAPTVYFKTASAIADGAKMTLLDASRITDNDKKLKSTNIIAESTFTVGTTLQGTGTLSLDENGNVIYTVGQGTPAPTPGSDNTIVLRGDMDVSDMQLTVDPQGPMGILYIGDATTKTPWTGGKQNVKDLTYFQNIHFCVVPWWEQKPALTITDGSGSNLSYTKVDAANVYFTNVSTLAKNQRMTLLDASRITDATKKLQAANIQKASKFTVGTTGEGEGELSLDANGNVIYTVTRGSSSGGDSPTIQAQEQTHKTVMGMEASMATLAVGNDFIGRTLDGLADVENEGKDGLSVFAAYGGGTSKYETGSYIRANTWNAILGLGKNNRFGNKDDKERGLFQWGAFFEYGSGNYSTHDCDVRGDGSAQYTGGGLLAKWKNDNGVYAEGSVRAGSVTDKASNMLHDILGGSYGYDTRANYLGAHVGLGKIYRFGDDHELDLYGKYFYTQRDGVSFDAGGRYNLDKVTSNILRVGMRYGMTGKKWNWFGGLAYEYEFDGKATGTADGAEIRAADISGGSLRAEVGVVMKPSEESPWSMRMSAEGYCGERQGFGGTLSLTYAF